MRKSKTSNITPNMIARLWRDWTPAQRLMFTEMLQAASAAHSSGASETEVIEIMKARYDDILKGLGVNPQEVQS